MTERPDNWIDPEVAKRLKDAQRAWGTQDALAAASGIAPGTLQKIIQGKTDPSLSSIDALCKVMKVSLDWIVSGKPDPTELPERVVRSLGAGGGSVVSGMFPATKRQSQAPAVDDDEFIKVPFFNGIEASAGGGALAIDQAPDVTLAFRPEWIRKHSASGRGLQAIRVRGDSMEPTLRNGDLIVIDTESVNPSDGLYVVNLGDELLVKRLQRLSPTRLVIASDNPLAGSSEIDLRDESQQPRIIGRVIWLGRDL